MSAPAEATHRLFLALWPDAAVRQRLAAIASIVAGGRKVPPDNLHLTLVFLGATSDAQWRDYVAALRDLPVPALTLSLERLGWWPRSGILWLGMPQPPPALLDLVNELNRRLAACGFSPESRPFQVHVTLARKFSGPLPLTTLAEPVVWPVDRVTLVESLHEAGGVRYVVRQGWPG
jgi:2'-5' RNA ligase